MSEAVAVPSLMIMALTVSEESLARDMTYIQTHRHKHTDTNTQTRVVYVNIFKVAYDFENKKNRRFFICT